MNIKTKNLIPPELVHIASNITLKNNLLGAAKETKARWARDLNLPQDGETIFFAGCGYQYTRPPHQVAGKSNAPEDQILREAVKVLGNLGIKFGYLAEDEPCCGGPLHYFGLEEEFAKQAQETYNRLKSSGVKRIISIVPSCTYTLRNLIPNRVDGYDLEVKHFSEVILESMQSRKLQFPRKVKVTYHDPCQLARYLGLIEEPRQILRAIKGIELVEAEWAKAEWATCCGGSDGFQAVFPELSKILAVNRARELIKTGAEIIVTHCPGCITQLKDGLKELKINDLEVLDLVQVVAMAMEA